MAVHPGTSSIPPLECHLLRKRTRSCGPELPYSSFGNTCLDYVPVAPKVTWGYLSKSRSKPTLPAMSRVKLTRVLLPLSLLGPRCHRWITSRCITTLGRVFTYVTPSTLGPSRLLAMGGRGSGECLKERSLYWSTKALKAYSSYDGPRASTIQDRRFRTPWHTRPHCRSNLTYRLQRPSDIIDYLYPRSTPTHYSCPTSTSISAHNNISILFATSIIHTISSLQKNLIPTRTGPMSLPQAIPVT